MRWAFWNILFLFTHNPAMKKSFIHPHAKNRQCEIPRCQPFKALFEIRSHQIKAVLFEKGSCRERSVSRAEIQVGNSYKEPKLGEFFIRIVHSSHRMSVFWQKGARQVARNSLVSFTFLKSLHKTGSHPTENVICQFTPNDRDLKNLPSGYLRESLLTCTSLSDNALLDWRW